MEWQSISGWLYDRMQRAGLSRVPRGAVSASVFLLVVLVAVSAVRFWPTQERAAPMAEHPVVESVEASPAPTTPTSLIVHVAGAVRRPGVYEVPDGSRVIDAVEAAGGTVGDAAPEAVNLARAVVDGEQVYVPEHGEDTGAAGGAAAVPAQGGAGASGPVNLNTAGTAELEALPGIGPATAAKIIADRDANGPYASLDDLARVSGIGPRKVEALEGLADAR